MTENDTMCDMSSPTAVDGSRDPIFACSGEMAERCATFDWSSTPLGEPSTWPASMRAVVGMVLRSHFPMTVTWGDEFVMIYNDGYIPTLGSKHPSALGGNLSHEFAEIWDEIGPRQRAILAGGEAESDEDVRFVLERGSGLEETFYSFCWSHVSLDGQGPGPGGVLTVLTERTVEVVGSRRLALLNALAVGAAAAVEPDEAVERTLLVLAEAGDDLVHGAYYGADAAGSLTRGPRFGTATQGAARSGDDETAQRVVETCWSTAEMTEAQLETGPAIALPVRASSRLVGVLLLGLHPLRPLDEAHRQWLALVGDQVSQAMGAAASRADEHARVEALAQLDAAKSEFLSTVSHELRTPLTLLLGPLDDALDDANPTLAPAQVSSMHQSAHRLLRLVNGLLDAAQRDVEPRVAMNESVAVSALTRDLVLPFEVAALRGGLTLTTAIDDVGVLSVDPSLWESIVINLTANAVKYTPYGWVEVELDADAEHVRFEVRDSGIGIREDDQSRIFDRFQRIETPSSVSVEGTGLGLAVVAEAVRTLGGTIEVTSTPGEGSTFTVRLPRVVASLPETAGPRSTIAAEVLARDVTTITESTGLAAAGEQPADGRPRILVVDDNEGIRSRVVGVLADLGSTVTARDGIEALEILADLEVDLVVTDMTMPRLNGLGLIERLRADPQHTGVPVIALSARAGSDAATSALVAGADDYVVKPFTAAELLARCRSTLELTRLRTEQASTAARAAMLAEFSHDLQTPMSVVMSALEMLSLSGIDDGARSDAVVRARDRMVVLDRLVRQFLDGSRIAAGLPLLPVTASVDLGDLVRRALLDQRGVTVEPVAGKPVRVMCDPRRTEQILRTLAIRARDAGEGSVGVRWTAVVRDPVAEHDAGGVDVEVYGGGAPSPGLAPPQGSDLDLLVSGAAAAAQGGALSLGPTTSHGTHFVLRLMEAN
jgi:signal transduction histidine kinase